MDGVMLTRRQGRELALQLLYALDVQAGLSADEALGLHLASLATPDEDSGLATLDHEARRFAERIVRGVREQRAAIDGKIAQASRNWRLERMARVDRNLLRLAVYEMTFVAEVPAKVAINEAIEIAKRFGTHESPAFVNGILDQVLTQLQRPAG